MIHPSIHSSIHPSIDFFLVALIRIHPIKFFKSSASSLRKNKRSQPLRPQRARRIRVNFQGRNAQTLPKIIPKPSQNLPKPSQKRSQKTGASQTHSNIDLLSNFGNFWWFLEGSGSSVFDFVGFRGSPRAPKVELWWRYLAIFVRARFWIIF